ncbi:MAG: alkaline phosphatase family protein [Candidatus Zixiibacteriota bacterium]
MDRVWRVVLSSVCGCVILFAAASVGAAPRLAVVIVVDQMRADYLTRLESEYTGGLNRLVKGGVRFTEAHHDHAVTVTSVGHAAIATGCFPGRHGIVGNSWFDRRSGRVVTSWGDSAAPVVGSTVGEGVSPAALLRPTLGEWLKEQSPSSRVFAISGKNYAAAMMGGHHPDGVWWYDHRTGNFITSTYYLTQVPDWVEAFNRSEAKDHYYRKGWERGWPEASYSSAHSDSFPSENDGIDITFPHHFDTTSRTPDSSYYGALRVTPFSDELLIDFAAALVRDEQLGTDTVPDLLWISCSATDMIGHAFGPDSREMVDNLLRLDGTIGGFLGFLDGTVGADNYVVVLASDHGVMPFPEDLARQGIMGQRVSRVEYRRIIDSVVAGTAEALGIGEPLIEARVNGIVLDTGAALTRGIAPEDLRQAVAADLRRVPFIDEVMTYDELFAPRAVVRGYRDVYRRSFCPDRAPDLALRLVEYTLIDDGGHGTTHGSPYDHDTHVPLLFFGQGVLGGQVIATPVRTVDIAPTLAAMIGIKAPEGIDGSVLTEVLAK